MKSDMENCLTFPRVTVARVFNDNCWIPIAPKVPGLIPESIKLTTEQEKAAKMFPSLASAALSRSNGE